MDQPTWLAHAWSLLGEREITGAGDNARILALYRDAGHPEIRHDETAWCAAFAGACLERARIRSTRSLMARSYLAWGQPIGEARLGAVTVLSRGEDRALGHVGFLVGATDASVVLLGGNQGDAVSVAAFPRARLLGFRWPAAAAAVEVPASSPADTADFERALKHVLEMEGGYTDDPHDPGGPTNLGITLRVLAQWMGESVDASSLPRLKEALRRMGPEQASAIYLARYWTPSGASELPPALAFMHFDAAVNHGVGTAVRMLQEALGVEADGEIGPVTRAAVSRADHRKVLTRYADIRRRRYRALHHFWRFGRGWLRRVDRTLERALHLTPSTSPQQKGSSDMIAPTPASSAKWWGQSMTVWGALITAVSTVLPALGPVIGIDITPELVKEAGTHIIAVTQAVAGLAGTLMTIYGRARATQPLERRPMSLRL